MGVALLLTADTTNMAASMRKAVLRQTSFPSLRRRCLCLSSRSFASGKTLHLPRAVRVVLLTFILRYNTEIRRIRQNGRYYVVIQMGQHFYADESFV